MATKRIIKRQQAIAALLSSRTVKEAAKKCFMNYQVLLKWLHHDDEFMEMFQKERQSLLDGIKASLLQSAVSGTKVIEDGLNDEMTSNLERFPIAKFAIETVLNLELADDNQAKGPATPEWDWVAPKSDDKSESDNDD